MTSLEQHHAQNWINRNISTELIEKLEALLSGNEDIYLRGVHSLEQAETVVSFRSTEGTGQFDIHGNNCIIDGLENGDMTKDSLRELEAYSCEIIEDEYKLTAKGVNATQSILELFAGTSQINGNFSHIVAFEGYLIDTNICNDGLIVEVDEDEEITIFEV